ncbi:Protein involved in cell division [Anaerostipes hadrus]|uniref:Protein involved in cell division n=1 Tax=Anaerostipes hadrus TaxID=649756 RepID=A0A174NJ47_ANAHA|nr:Fic family protein [Anaerostipes hadrus]CUP48603.1 Protein involved in cell division [Anaerostipes hadrus]
MRDRIYKAFHEDIEHTDFLEIDKLKQQLDELKPDDDFVPYGLKSYKEAFDVRFIHASVAIENENITLSDVDVVLEGKYIPANISSLRDIFSIKGCADGCALIDMELNKNRELTGKLIKEIHEKVLLEYPVEIRGVYRSVPVCINGSLTEVAKPEEISDLMHSLFWFFERSYEHPIGMAAAFHVMFENIHPFQDGNGRTGRLVMNYMLQQFGYPPIIIKHGPTNDYKLALQKWQVYGNSDMFLNLVKDCLVKELKEYIRIIEITRKTVKSLNE